MLLVPVVYGAFFALATIYLIKGGMSLMALGIGAIVLGVALSYCLHVLTHYKYVSDPETVLREQIKPVIMGSLTTIGAFAGLLFTKSELLSETWIFSMCQCLNQAPTDLVEADGSVKPCPVTLRADGSVKPGLKNLAKGIYTDPFKP